MRAKWPRVTPALPRGTTSITVQGNMPSLSAELPFGKGVKPKRGLRDLIGSSRGRSASEASWTAGCACSFRSFSQWNILRGLQRRSRPAASSRKRLNLREAAPPRSSRSFRASAVLCSILQSCSPEHCVAKQFVQFAVWLHATVCTISSSCELLLWAV